MTGTEDTLRAHPLSNKGVHSYIASGEAILPPEPRPAHELPTKPPLMRELAAEGVESPPVE